MKRLIYFMLLAVTSLTLASCEGKPGRDGRDGRDGLVNYYNIPVQINQNEWSYTNADNNNYFYAVISVPELTWDISEHGNMMVYREYDQGTNNAVQTPLPYSRHVEYQDNGEWYFYTESVDYEFTKGQVTIFYTASDFDYELNTNFVPEQMNFRIFIMF